MYEAVYECVIASKADRPADQVVAIAGKHCETDVLIWNARVPTQFYAQKEIWYDRKSYLPVKVILYDFDGRVLVRANLTNHRPVEVADQPQEKWPRIATSYSLMFPQSKSTMLLKLSDMALLSKSGHPRAGTIVFKDDPEVSKVIQVDEACEK